MIVVFGSINIDLVFPLPALPAPGETVLGGAYRMLPGGKGANQALAAARDGAPVTLIGAVGTDVFADPALALLREDGVDLTHVVRVAAPTGCAGIMVASGSGENLIAVASGANAAATADLVADALLGPGTTLVLQMELPSEETVRVIERASKRGARIVLNLAPAQQIDDAVLRHLDILIVNERELASLGVDAPTLATQLGITVVSTLGARGATAARSDGTRIDVPALPIKPVDTTGAGDTFVGVLAAALDRGEAFAAALLRANVAAGLACEVAGAQPGMPTRERIDRALASAQSLPR